MFISFVWTNIFYSWKSIYSIKGSCVSTFCISSSGHFTCFWMTQTCIVGARSMSMTEKTPQNTGSLSIMPTPFTVKRYFSLQILFTLRVIKSKMHNVGKPNRQSLLTPCSSSITEEWKRFFSKTKVPDSRTLSVNKKRCWVTLWTPEVWDKEKGLEC